MSKVFLTMAMSLDGFITGPHDDAQNPAGINGMRLMDWLDGVQKGGNTAGRLPAERPEQPARVRRGHVLRRRHHREADRGLRRLLGRRPPRRRADLRPHAPTTGGEPVRASSLHHRRHRVVRAAGQSRSRRPRRDAARRLHRPGVPEGRSSRPASTSSSDRSCWVRGGGCSTTCHPSTSTSTWFAPLTPPARCTCATRYDTPEGAARRGRGGWTISGAAGSRTGMCPP